MRTSNWWIVFGWLVLVQGSSARVWKSTTGHELEAELVRQAQGMATLRTPDGHQTTILISKLAEEDQAYLRELLAQEAPATVLQAARPKPPSDFASGDPGVVGTLQSGKTTKRTAAGDTGISYVVYAPATFKAEEPSPIIVAFSPGGNGGQMINAMKTAADKMGWLLVGCNLLKNGMPDPVLEKRMEDEVLDDIFANLPHDRRRIYFAGFSGGAYRSYHLTARRKEPVAGIVAYGGWIGGEDFYKLPYRKGMTVAIINGKDDRAANSWVKRDSDVLRKHKCTIRAFDFDGGHTLPPSETTETALQWLEEQWVKRGAK